MHVMAVTVKFIGALRHVSGAGELALNCKDNVSIRELMREITEEVPALTRSLIDQQLEEPTPNVLILVNGREISVLNGLETNLQDGDEVVLVPVVHGG
jgi:molybdopterin synthase sulfur carrier subunit